MAFDYDVIVIGAGAAGIAAGRALRAAGLTFTLLEARARTGGRAAAITLGGRRIDTGAHWMHMQQANPLVPLARELGVALRPMPGGHPYYDGAERLERESLALFQTRWEMIENAVAAAVSSGPDSSVGACFPDFGEWTETFAFNHSLYCGRPIEEISAADYARVEDSDNLFPAGAYADILTRLAEGLPLRLDAAVTRISWRGGGVTIEAAGAEYSARRCIITIPVMVLQSGSIAFDPPLPEALAAAIASFLRGNYEHVILHWPETPFGPGDADRLVFFKGGRSENMTLLAHIEGSDFHSAEIGGLTAAGIGSAAEKEAFVRRFLASRFGAIALKGLTAAHATDWWSDPFSLGSWSVAPPGKAFAREALQAPVDGRLWFAGEAASPTQWGTVGGAWLEGCRAAREVIRAAG